MKAEADGGETGRFDSRVRFASPDAVADPAPQVDFIVQRTAQDILVRRYRNAGTDGPSSGKPFARNGRAGIQRGDKIRPRKARLRPRAVKPGYCCGKAWAALVRPRDQVVQ